MGKVENGKPSYQWNVNGNVKRKWRKIPFRKGLPLELAVSRFVWPCFPYLPASPSAQLTLHSHRLIKYSTISKEIFSWLFRLPLPAVGCPQFNMRRINRRMDGELLEVAAALMEATTVTTCVHNVTTGGEDVLLGLPPSRREKIMTNIFMLTF